MGWTPPPQVPLAAPRGWLFLCLPGWPRFSVLRRASHLPTAGFFLRAVPEAEGRGLALSDSNWFPPICPPQRLRPLGPGTLAPLGRGPSHLDSLAPGRSLLGALSLSPAPTAHCHLSVTRAELAFLRRGPVHTAPLQPSSGQVAAGDRRRQEGHWEGWAGRGRPPAGRQVSVAGAAFGQGTLGLNFNPAVPPALARGAAPGEGQGAGHSLTWPRG